MGLLKKSEPTKPDAPLESPAPFVMPSLEDSSPAYAALIAKRLALNVARDKLQAERRKLEKEIALDTSTALRPAIANLLGDDEDSKSHNFKRVAEIHREVANIDSALEVLRERILTERGKASRIVYDAVRPEYGRRVSAVAKALEAVQAARRDYDDLRNMFEAEDIAWSALGPLTLGWLGDPRDGHIPRFLNDVREAGYYA
ncbi:hypothetical protein JQK88_30575 [Mesorhizobium caraganae]|uniref:hypothetical protein n=1 Tax=Mesorhizobium caraganae TaxID=483206 RepID=UPI001939B23F|nr:hypothetical protein [Mesorhizobium caraganae]MBM2715475.1 hypothetical protein [Mesorhizobium caraganae]